LSHPPDPDAIAAAERQIPALREADYEPQSPRNKGYNCFAWAARDSDSCWDPPGLADWTYWPEGVPTWESLENYRRAYATVGFVDCDDGALEEGVEKIAIFVDTEGSPIHAARQLPNGRWTSKLGKGIDIEHDFDALEGDPAIGDFACFLKRPSPGPPPDPPGPLLILPKDAGKLRIAGLQPE
jgi:hypothetical protein